MSDWRLLFPPCRYRDDFGETDEDLLQWVYERLNDQDKKKQLGEVIQSSTFKIKHIPYDWGNNDKD